MTNPTFRLDDRVAMITGGSRGLGKAMALGFAEAGADVVVASRKGDACEDVAGQVRELGRRALAVPTHVGDWDDLDRLVEATIEEFGRIDVLVNNAGMAPVPPSLKGVTSELFDKTIDVNLKGPLRLTALAADHMPEGGSIINISSIASAQNTPVTVVYGAAKAGLNSLTRASAIEFAPRGIRVNAIVCGTFRTDTLAVALPTDEAVAYMEKRVGLGRLAEPEEIVGTALWLASDASSYVTGECVTVDGGPPAG